MAISLQAEDKEALLRKQVIQTSVWAFCVYSTASYMTERIMYWMLSY
jgi:hypothetical protein